MSRAKKILEMYDSEPGSSKNPLQVNPKVGAKRQRSLTQYAFNGNVSKSSNKTKPTLESGVYNIKDSMQGIYFELHEINTDKLLRFDDKRQTQVLEEVQKFRNIRDNFKKMGFTHKRGICLFGPPGTGKSCLVKLVIEDFVKGGDVVFICRDSSTLVAGLKEFREIEPDRLALVVMEDADELIRHNEHAILELLDGDNQMDGILYLATTNYLDRFPPRMLRAGRFDRKLKIDQPPYEGRLAYLKQKLAVNETELNIADLAQKTEGFSFGQLRELIISTYCLEYKLEDSIKRIRDNLEESAHTKYTDSDVKRALKERKLFSMNESRARRVLEQLPTYEGISSEGITASLSKKLKSFSEFDGITVDSADYDLNGSIFVSFVNLAGESLDVVFVCDSEDGPGVILPNLDDDEDSEVTMLDLGPMAPSIVTVGPVQYLDLLELSWMTKSVLKAIFQAGDLCIQPESDLPRYDAVGNKVESAATVVRGGKEARLPVMHRESKRKLKPKHRLALNQSVRKSAGKKRVSSLKLS